MHAVNGWRGPGAIGIAIGHFAIATDLIAIRHLEPIALLVDLIFVFSGLLITQAYTAKLSNARAIPEYLIRRVGRIWPVQAATLAILVGYELMKLLAQTLTGQHFSSPPFSPEGLHRVTAIPTNLLLIHALDIHNGETWNFPSWSLSVEFVTYAVFALVCLVRPLLRRCLSGLVIAGSIFLLVTIAPYHMRSTYDFGVFRCLAGFFAGSLCFEALDRWPLPSWSRPTLVEVVAVASVILWMSSCVDNWLAFAAPFVFCLFVMAFFQGNGLVSRLLTSKPARIMAELSFSVYMVHGIVLVFLFAVMHQYDRAANAHLFVSIPNPLARYPGAPFSVEVLHLESAFSKGAFIATYIAIVALTSFAVFHFIEVPGRTLFNGLAKRTRGISSPTISTPGTTDNAKVAS